MAEHRVYAERLKTPVHVPRALRVQYDYRSGICQRISGFPALRNTALVLENTRLPRNPRCADRGEGCAAVRTTCRLASINLIFFCAYAPHSRKTTGSSFSPTARITVSVNFSQPLSLCELGWCARTVNTAFSIRTPCSAQGTR